MVGRAGRKDHGPGGKVPGAAGHGGKASYRELGLRTSGACPRDAPELPSTANARHQQQPANMKLAPTLNLRATHRDTLVMRSSLGGDEDQGAVVPSVVRDRRRRARCVPDRPVNAGNPRSLTDTFTRLLTCAWTGPSIAAYDLLSSRSRQSLACRGTVQQQSAATASIVGDRRWPRSGR